MLATIKGARYVARCSLHNPANIMKSKQAVKKAFQNQVEGKGFSIVELLSTCSTNWGMTPAPLLRGLRRDDPRVPARSLQGRGGPVE
jgi:2-oxoglutarate ferredoxin oxidoreductase subunit beta